MDRDEARDIVENLLYVNRDELVETFKVGYKNMILEADEWRPLVDHVIGLIALAVEEYKNRKD